MKYERENNRAKRLCKSEESTDRTQIEAAVLIINNKTDVIVCDEWVAISIHSTQHDTRLEKRACSMKTIGLIGGMSWFSPEAELIVPLIEKAIKDKKVVGGICNASVFLAMHGFLNNVKHTSNTIDYLKQHVGERYTGDSNYVDQQAVRDGKIITANGTGQLEFCREILYALEADTAEAIEKSYLFYKNGFCPE